MAVPMISRPAAAPVIFQILCMSVPIQSDLASTAPGVPIRPRFLGWCDMGVAPAAEAFFARIEKSRRLTTGGGWCPGDDPSHPRRSPHPQHDDGNIDLAHDSVRHAAKAQAP